MEKPVSIFTRTGSVTLKAASAKALVFYSPRKGADQPGAVESVLPAAAISAGLKASCAMIGRKESFPSCPGKRVEVCGAYSHQTFALEEGSMLKLFVSTRPGYGRRAVMGNAFLTVRQAAARRKWVVPLLESNDTVFTFAELEGRFDVTPLEAALAVGVHVPEKFRGLYPADPVAFFRVQETILEPEASAPIVRVQERVTNEDGESADIVRVRRRRSIG